ncbi:AAA family ATPase [Actinosynnema pretiosum subsp. pretiosum]|uniref:AAA family ATPase n=2 Tax=Actinosynnema TaxID=40566 RepID=A0A1U9Y7S0_9PSEU|nr:BTAD domain-containing putative transcriptional regulator [Actinosynnema mirum]ACU37101.1 transcriptional regulator, putative ATPase, winged helix family [Actinosynnema mirum DSM 43827]AQZ37105.1 transcriptional activator [Actinosynnema pretiosum subsp. pretiosum]QUF05281.1 AAA family ATPase [Actinosynnema pretiosum subsp. pretiosum]
MRFQLLGPLEVVDRSRPVALGGTKQRAALGYLLLHPNSVVPTSSLLKALWPKDMPPTGRKMLQNAVAALRGVLTAAGDSPGAPALLTHTPGYLLRVDPEDVDLSRFRRLVHAGRADLTAGSWQRAARTLRDAIGLWRGPLLADLVEQGVDWPELAAVRNTRLAALEDCVEAEFASGRYGEMIYELERWVEAEPLRERLCGQLMRALYHCGRQADALGVYRRTRARLVDELGLDPGRELRELERAILNQEVPHRLPARRETAPAARSGAAEGGGPVAAPPVAALPVGIVPQRQAPPAPAPVTPAPVALAPLPPASAPTAELKHVSVLMVLTRFEHDVAAAPPEEVDDALSDVAAAVREEVERAGGVVTAKAASLIVALFGSTRSGEDDATRAVRAALAVRDRLAHGPRGAGPAALGVTAAVATGHALVRRHPGRAPEVGGGVLDRCMRLLAHVSPGEVRVCEETRGASEGAIGYDGPHDPVRGSWATGARQGAGGTPAAPPLVDRDRELALLRGLLEQVGRRSRTHLVTVLGEPGIGKSRLVDEFQRVAETSSTVVVRCPRLGGGGDLAPLADALAPRMGIGPADPVGLVAAKLAAAARGSGGAGERADRLLARLRVLFGLDVPDVLPDGSFAAWRHVLEDLGGADPLVLVLEDLHWAGEALLDFVDHLTAEATSSPLLVVVTARPELFDRRPAWGGGKAEASTITLDPLADQDVERLLTALCVRRGPASAPTDEARAAYREVIAHIGGNPLFAVEYARVLADAGPPSGGGGQSPPLPPLVRRVVAARIDSLPADAKAVLLDAAVLGEDLCEEGVRALGGGAVPDVARALEHLERREVLRRDRDAERATAYAFRSPLVRDVAYLTIPQHARAEKHRRAADWLERVPGHDALRLVHHGLRSGGCRPVEPSPVLPQPRQHAR